MVGKRIRSERQGFNPGTYGCKSLRELVEKCGEFDLRREKGVDFMRHKVPSRKESGS